MNMINLVGRLTRDPELKEIGGGRSVCELRLAAENPGRGRGRLRGAAGAVSPARCGFVLHEMRLSPWLVPVPMPAVLRFPCAAPARPFQKRDLEAP
jgi:Single-strand binding protein family